MCNNDINNLRNTINSKFSKILETPSKKDIFKYTETNNDVLNDYYSYVSKLKNVSILYIDDEENNLNSFYACFRNDYNIFLAHDTDIALDILHKEKIDILITDQKMPKLTGIEFLLKIQTIFKKLPVFMITSAHLDTESYINKTHNLEIFKYFPKPFDLEEIKSSVYDAYYYMNR